MDLGLNGIIFEVFCFIHGITRRPSGGVVAALALKSCLGSVPDSLFPPVRASADLIQNSFADILLPPLEYLLFIQHAVLLKAVVQRLSDFFEVGVDFVIPLAASLELRLLPI